MGYQTTKGRKTLIRICAFTVLSVFASGAASPQAMDAIRASAIVPHAGIVAEDHSSSLSPTPAMADSCLPLLKKIRHTSPLSAMDRNRRSAGQAVALGLVLGLRVALGPKEIVASGQRVQVQTQLRQRREGDSMHALAVADYRRCKNENALMALNDSWRWKK